MSMFRIPCIAIAGFILLSHALAQEVSLSVAKLRGVSGNVLVSTESGLAAGTESLRLLAGTRVITMGRSEVVVVYDDGCEVRLKENQRFEVARGRDCAALIAMVQPILVAPVGIAAATAGAASAYLVTLPALGAAGFAALRSLRESQPVSPS